MHQKQNNKTNQLNSQGDSIDEKPPILGSWKNIYLVVLLNLTAIIILLYFFSEAFR
jgi:hypothetical protein